MAPISILDAAQFKDALTIRARHVLDDGLPNSTAGALAGRVRTQRSPAKQGGRSGYVKSLNTSDIPSLWVPVSVPVAGAQLTVSSPEERLGAFTRCRRVDAGGSPT
jgi:hypothetical protein